MEPRKKLNKVCLFDLVQTTSSEFVFKKGDGNDGEPDACQKLEFEKQAKRGQRPQLTSEVTSKTCQNDFKLHTCGWFGMIFENIQSDLPNEVRGQS